MASAPTTGATAHATTWAGRPGIAAAVRAVLFVAPAVASWAVTRAVSGVYWRPAGLAGLAMWAAQVLVVGSGVVLLVARAARRLLPLAALYNLSLAFPDQAPSRFKVALRTGTIRNLQTQVDDIRAHGYGATATETTARIVELVAALGRHERLTRGHTERVRAYTDLIAEELGVSEEDRAKLRWASMLHDIGKLAVPAEILNKAGRPTEEEWAILASHPVVGGELVEPLAEWLGEWRFTASQHHERWDGTGYPAKLAGTQISLGGRIVAVADSYDVITSARTYKAAMTPAAGRQELVRCAGTQFDPAVVRAFLNVSLGETKARAGVFGWLAEMVHGVATAVSHSGQAAGGVVAAGAVASMAAVALSVPPAPVEPTVAAKTVSVVAGKGAPPEAAPPVAAARENRVDAPRAVGPASGPPSSSPPPSPPPSPLESAGDPVPPTLAPPTTAASSAAPVTSTAPTTTRAGSAPVAADDAYRIDENSTDPVRFDVLRNDTDPDGDLDLTTLEVVAAPASGRASVRDGRLFFEPPERFRSTVVVYRLCDRTNRCDTARVTIRTRDDD